MGAPDLSIIDLHHLRTSLSFGDVIRCNPKAKKPVMKSKALHRQVILLP